MIATGITYHAYGRDMPDGTVYISYAGGSALGVGLVTLAREGMNARGTLLGAAAGTGVGIGFMALAGVCETGESPQPEHILGMLLYLIFVPLGSSLGHLYF